MAAPRNAVTDMQNYQQQRYESQIDPFIEAAGYNYGRGSETDFGNQADIMNMYRSIASGSGSSAPGAGGGGGGGDYSYGAESWTPENIKYNDPFNSYAGYEGFSKTGGYSPEDISNLRARGTAPIRAAYANAEREIGRQRSLQGGYSPNAFALQGRMAREQGQLGADTMQNVEAGMVDTRNANKFKGLEGMTDVEKQRLAGDLDVQKYNAGINNTAKQQNTSARNSAAAGSASNRMNADLTSAAANRNDQFKALAGMTNLYGTTPGMSQLFGQQTLSAIGQSGTQGGNQVANTYNAQQLPGQYEQTTGRVKDWIDTAARVANPIIDQIQASRKKPETTQPIVGSNPGFGNVPSAPRKP